MKTPFKVGDRVAVYTENGRRVYSVVNPKAPVNPDLMLLGGDHPNSQCFLAHPKQCRRLIKKPRRRVWVAEMAWCSKRPNDSLPAYAEPFQIIHAIEFVEVRKKKV